MNEEQRNSILCGTWLMQKVQFGFTKTIDGHICLEVRELVQFGLCLSPVKCVPPVRRQPLDISQRASISPLRVFKLRQ